MRGFCYRDAGITSTTLLFENESVLGGVSQFLVVAKNTSEMKSSSGRLKSTAEEKICARKEKKCREKTREKKHRGVVIAGTAASTLTNVCDCSPGAKKLLNLIKKYQSYPRRSANLKLDKRTPTNGY